MSSSKLKILHKTGGFETWLKSEFSMSVQNLEVSYQTSSFLKSIENWDFELENQTLRFEMETGGFQMFKTWEIL